MPERPEGGAGFLEWELQVFVNHVGAGNRAQVVCQRLATSPALLLLSSGGSSWPSRSFIEHLRSVFASQLSVSGVWFCFLFFAFDGFLLLLPCYCFISHFFSLFTPSLSLSLLNALSCIILKAAVGESEVAGTTGNHCDTERAAARPASGH